MADEFWICILCLMTVSLALEEAVLSGYRAKKGEWQAHTIKGVHQSITGDSGASTAGGSREGVVLAGLVSAHEVLDGLIRREVNRMRRSCGHRSTTVPVLFARPAIGSNLPAPTITLDMPRHKLKIPSEVAIR